MVTKRYYVDEKETIWFRSYYEIEAETEKECDSKMIEMCDNDQLDYEGETEHLFDTIESISVEENCGNATMELFEVESPVRLWSNLPK